MIVTVLGVGTSVLLITVWIVTACVFHMSHCVLARAGNERA